MNFAGRNFQQLQLDMLGANQAMQTQRKGIVYKRSSLALVLIVIAVGFIVAISFLATADSRKAYVYYNGALYLDHGYETNYTEIVTLGGEKCGVMFYCDTTSKNLSKNLETNSPKFDGGIVYTIPNEAYQIIIQTTDHDFYRLTRVD